MGSLGARGDGRMGLAVVKQGAVAGLAGGDGAPTAMGGGGWAWELRWGEVKPFPKLFWAGRGRNDELDGELRTAAMLCHGSDVPESLGGGERAWEDQ